MYKYLLFKIFSVLALRENMGSDCVVFVPDHCLSFYLIVLKLFSFSIVTFHKVSVLLLE